MPGNRSNANRSELLADVAEMYFLDGMTQAQIAERVGVTRSMVSRLLTVARQQGIVEVKVHRPLVVDRELTGALRERFSLLDALVVAEQANDLPRLLHLLGEGGAQVLARNLKPGTNLGIVWGTAMNMVVDAVVEQDLAPLKVVQLCGALGAVSDDYDGHAVVSRLAHKLNGAAFYLNAPLMVDDREMVAALSATPGVRGALAVGRECDVVLLGIGGTDPKYCSYCITGNLTNEQLEGFVSAGAVGVVYGHYFDSQGRPIDTGFADRLVGISLEELLSIPLRIGVAGGRHKTQAVAGALRGGFVNAVVTDAAAATAILSQPQSN